MVLAEAFCLKDRNPTLTKPKGEFTYSQNRDVKILVSGTAGPVPLIVTISQFSPSPLPFHPPFSLPLPLLPSLHDGTWESQMFLVLRAQDSREVMIPYLVPLAHTWERTLLGHVLAPK